MNDQIQQQILIRLDTLGEKLGVAITALVTVATLINLRYITTGLMNPDYYAWQEITKILQ